MKLTAFFAALVATVSMANAAVTVTVRNFSSATVGVPIVNSAGVPLDQGQAFASAGIFTSVPNFSTATAAQILAAFTPLDSSPVALNATFDGLFSAADMSGGAYPTGFSGSNAYIVVGNNATLASSTAIAVYFVSGNVFTPVDGVGNASVTLSGTTTAGWVYGTLTPVTVQPSLTNAAFTTGVQLISSPVPEPSAALLGVLGALGLLRRRR